MLFCKKQMLAIAAVLLSCACRAEHKPIILGDSAGTHLTVDLWGGAFIDFRLASQTLNPFAWNIPVAGMPENNRKGAPFQGHFLCLGRWGAPTEGEIRAGVPHNGQPGNGLWKIVSQQKDSLLLIRSDAPLDGIAVERHIQFDKYNAVFKVTDKIQSLISMGRPFNIVQHATLGTPFVTSSTIIDSNAGAGFMQHLSYPNPHAFEYQWPTAIMDSLNNTIDLTQTTSASYVSTHLFADSIGWITASEPENRILIGYIWKTAGYPWLNLWQDVKNGQIHAKGLEFGTTGIGRPYQDLLATDTRFHGVNSFFYLDALETIEKSFIGFQIRIPTDYQGVKEIKLGKNQLILIEKNTNRPLIIKNSYSF